MATEQSYRRERIARLVAISILLLAIFFIGFLIWTGQSAAAMDEAQAALLTDERLAVKSRPWLIFTPITPTAESGFIFYPGALVDPRAYAPAAREIAATGYLVVIVPMPFNLAIFAPARAQEVIAAYPAINHWAIGGHSLGGVMAANFVADYPNAVEALVLWASYPEQGRSLARRDQLVVASIYGTLDGLSTIAKIDASRSLLPDQTDFVAIEGGNHSQFGWYGAQRGDNPATISREVQQAAVVTATVAVLAKITEK
jgi:hypothetical protein